MRDEVMLAFKAYTASLHIGFRKKATMPTITFDLECQRLETLRTPEGDDLTAMPWALTVYATESYSEAADAEDAIGYMRYAGNGNRVSAAVGGATFERLLAATQEGRLPRHIGVTVKGLTRGPSPGDPRMWDTDKHASLTVREVSFSLPLGVDPLCAEGTQAEGAMPITTIHLSQAQSALRAAAKQLSHWLALAVAAVLLIAALRAFLG